MSRTIDIDETKSFYPSSLNSNYSEYYSVNASHPIEYGYEGSDSTSYAQFVLATGSNAYTYIHYEFDTSSIPDGATINSVSCSVKCNVSTTSSRYVSTRTAQMYSGNTAKGSSTTFTNSAAEYDLTVGTWTRAELENAAVRLTVRRGTSSTSSTSYYVRFYGATLTVAYSVNGTAYSITATSNVDDITISPATQEVFEGGSTTLTVDASSLDDVEVLDNDTDVTDQLVQKRKPTGGTIERYPESYSTSGSISGTNYQYCIGKGSDTASSSGNDYSSSGSGSTAHIDYSFDFSDIPENATIDSVTVTVKGHCESTSNSSEVATLQAYSGSTAKGSEAEFTSTTDTVKTLSVGTWTRAELQSAILRFTIGYYGGKVVGATWEVTYSVPSSTNPYYYEYTISNIQDDHIVIINETGPFIPPEEDENYTYYPVTISSINAITDPHSGTTRIKEGENVTVTITPTESKITLALDNGVDISSQLVAQSSNPTYSVDSVSGASYGFSLNQSGYYESTNQGQSLSAALARVNLSLPTSALVTFSFINYAEATYDFGIFGNLDDALSTSASADSDCKLACSAESMNTSAVQTLSYEVPAGEHFIDVKFYKDNYTDNNNDSLQFKVAIESTGVSDYTYTLSNIQANHSLIFVFGDVEYYFVNSSGTGSKLFPDGQSVVLRDYSYRLVIVPNDTTSTVTATDNGTDITSSLVRTEATDSKTGKTIVNYTYEIASVTAAHTIVVSAGSVKKLYIKANDTWREFIFSKVYVKQNGSWVEQSDIAGVFNVNTNYVKGN